MADKGKPIKVRILGCAVAHQGTDKRGEEYTLYEIKAAREDGEVITDKKLQCFSELPVGDEVLDLIATPFQSEKHGLSFTLSRKGHSGGGGSAKRVSELQGQVTDLVERMQRVEAWIRGRGASGSVPAAAPVAAAPAAGLDERFGAEAPY